MKFRVSNHFRALLPLLWMAIGAWPGPTLSAQHSGKYLERGHHFYDQDQLDSARHYYQLVADVDTPDVALSGQTSLLKLVINQKDFAAADSIAAIAESIIEKGKARPLTVAKYQSIRGEGWWRNGEYKRGIDQLQTVAASLKILDEPAELGQVYKNIAVAYQNQYKIDSSVVYIERAYELLRSSLDPGDKTLGYFYNDIAVVYIEANKTAEAEEFLKKAIKALEKYGEADGERMSMTLSNLGALYHGQSKYALSREMQIRALNIARARGLDEQVASALFNLGVAAYTIGDFGTAIQYVEESTKMRQATYGKDHPKLINYYYAMSIIKSSYGDYRGAIAVQQDLLALTRQTTGEINNRVALYLDGIGTYYSKLNQPDSAAHYLQAAINTYEQSSGKHHPDLARSLHEYAIVLYDTGRYGEALSYSLRAAQIMAASGLDQRPEYANLLTLRSDILANLGREKESGDLLADAQRLLLKEGEYALDLETSEVLASLCESAFARYERFPTPAHLAEFMTLTTDYLALSDRIRQQFRDPYTKRLLSAGRESFFENMLEAYVKLYRASPEERFLQRIYELAEHGKANGLRDQLRTGVTSYRDVPASVIDTLEAVQSRIEKLYYARSDAMPGQQDSLGQALLAERLRLEEVQHNLESEYPDYYRLTVSVEVPARSRVQSKLREQSETVILYFRAETNYHALVIGPTDTELVELGEHRLVDRLIKDWQQAVTSVLTDRHLKIGNDLYRLIWEPLAPALTTERVKIIPEAALQSIPFAALSKSPDRPKYLLRDRTISYAYSLTLLMEQQAQSARGGTARVSSIAPGFSEQQKAAYLAGLDSSASADQSYLATVSQPWSLQLADRFRQLYRGESLTNEKATESGVKNLLSQVGGILVFATHGLVDAAAPLQSKLQLTKTGEIDAEDGYLSVAEIFGQRIPAELSILGVCESGVGEYTSGEGQLSLAYGFSYAGCGSTVNTLWPVDNKTNSEIIELFLGHLSDGLPRAEALRRAQLDFLETASVDEQHPFYWAAMVAQGKDGVIDVSARNRWWWIFGLGMLAVFFLFGLYRWRR